MSFMQESGGAGKSYMEWVSAMAETSALDEKTRELAYLSVLAAVRLTGGLPFHVASAKKAGATRDEVKSAILVGMPAAGLAVIEAFDIALTSYDEA
uniref:Carboxymuconolactone decarboxylase family protein n=2 Tax=Breznakiella homolactica TaxID=2798577 RepID=A0A7T7XRW2_9SPIR